jgi:DHA1 family bicyclomycin/chloramphenicol resistance-like MFS transporter
MPLVQVDLGVSTSEVMLATTAFLLGVAGGQFVFGGLSDRWGRRRLLIAGLAVFTIASAGAALAPAIPALLVARLAQGLAAAAPLVLSKAIVRDLTEGADAIRSMSVMTAAAGMLNILAPVLGGVATAFAGWRATHSILALVGVLATVAAWRWIPETLPAEARGATTGVARWRVAALLRNRPFVLFAATQALSYAAMISYVSASPFIFQDMLGFDSAAYGLLFAANVAAIAAVAYGVNRVFSGVRPPRLVAVACLISAVGAGAVVAAWSFDAPTVVTVLAITTAVAPLGANAPNLAGLALSLVSRPAGTAAALLGVIQFAAGAAVAPVVGSFGARTPVPAMTLLGVLSLAAVATVWAASRAQRA